MTTRIPRLAASVSALLAALAVLDVSTAAAANPVSTTCGAGTLHECGKAPVVSCDWNLEVNAGIGGTWGVRISKTNCRVTGYVPLYKDREAQSTLSGACNLLNPFLGLPAGAGCSDDDES